MSKLNVCIVGSGRAGGELHLPAFHSIPGVQVYGICDPDQALTRKVADKYHIPFCFDSLEAALNTGNIQVVSICTPPQTHLPLARLAMEHGCHVLLEKPMTVTLKEADELLACQKRTNRKLSVVHQNKFQPGILQMQHIVQNGEAGDILQLDMSWLSNGDLDRMVSDPNFWCHSIPGGRWAESLPHQLYIAYALVGKMRLIDVVARKLTSKWPWMSVDEVNVTLESKKGYVNIRMSANPQEQKRSLYILHGTRQSFLFSNKMVIPVSPDAVGLRRRIRNDFKDLICGIYKIFSRYTTPAESTQSGGPHARVISLFVKHVLHDTPPPTTIEEAYHVEELTHQFGVAMEELKS